MRLNKYIAMCGIASRRKSDELIISGNVSVNGVTVTEMGYDINPDSDTVAVRGKIIKPEEQNVTYMLYKPKDCVTTSSDQYGRKTVLDFVPGGIRVYPVGRLDYDTTGLLLLTNDGDLAFRLSHPKNEVEKVYIARVKGVPENAKLDAFRRGLRIEDYVTTKAEISVLKKANSESVLRITIHEGRNRQVRKMCAAIGHEVIALHRAEYAGLTLESLQPGEFRELTQNEILILKSK